MPRVDPEFLVEKRNTSAGYRIPLTKRPASSEYHQKCVPAQTHQRAPVAATSTKSGPGDAKECDVVTQDKIWKQAVNKEHVGVKQW